MGNEGTPATRRLETVVARVKMRLVFAAVAALAVSLGPAAARAQLSFPGADQKTSAANPLADTSLSPGKALLLDLEARFAKDVAARGGAGFASWFAEDGVTLGNGVAPVVGKEAIAKSANWLAKDYQLTWTPTDAKMGPSGDIGYTWGHFEAKSKDANGNPVSNSGRYMTIWRHEKDGSWKVVLDAGGNDAPEGGDCCSVK
jgi:ketosteroid isomerase-like protein